jgi:hypothetical protein
MLYVYTRGSQNIAPVHAELGNSTQIRLSNFVQYIIEKFPPKTKKIELKSF